MSDKCCEGVRPAKFSRRYFMKQGGIAMVGLSTVPAFSATRHCLHALSREEAARRPFPARRRRRTQHRCAIRRAKLLPHAPQLSRFRSRVAAIATPLSISTASLACILLSLLSRRSSPAIIWQLFTPPARPIPRVPISTRRIIWSPVRPASKPPKMAGSIALSAPFPSKMLRPFVP